MIFNELHYEISDRVGVITLHRPDRLNAWTPSLATELRRALSAARFDRSVRCVVLTGAGRAFCAGMDMEVLRAGQTSEPAVDATASSAADEAQRYGYFGQFDKPLFAAINGAAVGVGMCLALHCDLRYVVAGAKMAFPYARRGLVAEHGLAWLLPRSVSPMHAADLLLSGRTLSAEEAASMGLANLLPAEGFLEAVIERARDIANTTSPRAVRIIKRQLRDARYQTLGEATQVADREIAACRDTDDFREGVQHFLEKRAPIFIGS